MDLRQIKQALVLSETLNFHRAAERLHMAQPPLSTAIRKLEEELGVVLFERLPSGLRLTPVVTPYDLRLTRSLFLPARLARLVPRWLGWFLVVTGRKPHSPPQAQGSSR